MTNGTTTSPGNTTASTIPNDDLTGDLQKILGVKWTLDEVYDPDTTATTETSWAIPDDVKKHLMEKLTMYITKRDHRILEHGIALGKSQAADAIDAILKGKDQNDRNSNTEGTPAAG
jgi:hypothetical protein